MGARVAGVIAEQHGDAGLPPGSVRLRFTGTAGQSFGAFVCRGVHLELEGEANDYVGKGLSGGEITIRPFRRAGYADMSHQHLIIGNTVLYGATGGKLFAAGQVGDRFAVRNSGAVAVIEGAGNHCCEYMTGGHRRRAGPGRPELCRRNVEWCGLRDGREPDLQQPGQSRHGGAERAGAGGCRTAAALDPGARGEDGKRPGPEHPGPVGRVPAPLPEGHAQRRGSSGGGDQGGLPELAADRGEAVLARRSA